MAKNFPACTVRKTIFSFFQTSWKDGLYKKIALEFDLSCFIGKDYIYFSRKWKMIFLKKKKKKKRKKHGNMVFNSNVLKRWSFQKGLVQQIIFLVLSGKVVFFSWKHGIFSLDGKWGRKDLSQEIHRNMIFSTWYFPHRPWEKKNQRRSYPAKIHLKVIDIPDRRPRKSPGHSLCLHGEIYRRFHILLSSKKKNRKHNI